jgi:hypothetical protein
MNTNYRQAPSPSVAKVELSSEIIMRNLDRGIGGMYANAPPQDVTMLGEDDNCFSILCDSFDSDPCTQATDESTPMDVESESHYGTFDRVNTTSAQHTPIGEFCSVIAASKGPGTTPPSFELKHTSISHRKDSIERSDISVQNNGGRATQHGPNRARNLRVNSSTAHTPTATGRFRSVLACQNRPSTTPSSSWLKAGSNSHREYSMGQSENATRVSFDHHSSRRLNEVPTAPPPHEEEVEEIDWERSYPKKAEGNTCQQISQRLMSNVMPEYSNDGLESWAPPTKTRQARLLQESSQERRSVTRTPSSLQEDTQSRNSVAPTTSSLDEDSHARRPITSTTTTFSPSTKSAPIGKACEKKPQLNQRQASGNRPTFNTTNDRRGIVEVCIVLDTPNKSMARFLNPLRSNLVRFGEILSVAKGNALRMSIVTPTENLDFTSAESEFRSFINDVALHDGDRHGKEVTAHFPISTELLQALNSLKKLGWSSHADISCKKYVYLFTCLSSDSDEEQAKVDPYAIVQKLSDGMPKSATVLVGCWRNDNAFLLEASQSEKVPFSPFKMLSLKEMVSCAFPEVAIPEVDTCERSLSSIKRNTRVRIDVSCPFRRLLPRFDACNQKSVSIASITVYEPLESIGHMQLSSPVDTWSCWMERGGSKVDETRDLIVSDGAVRDAKDIKITILIFCFKLDVLQGKTTPTSQLLYRQQAFISAVSKFLAIQYNKDHRPSHCAEIRFLEGGMIEEKDSKGRSFYVECLPSSAVVDAFMKGCKVFCDSEGIWNGQEIDETLLRFALTCFKLSGGDVMLTGLKGIRSGNAIYLSAPVLLSKIGDPSVNSCHAQYMSKCRTATKSLMEKRRWNLKIDKVADKAGKASNPPAENVSKGQRKPKGRNFWGFPF